jgi:glycerol-3-phosphate acyltransferase PlsY
MQIVFDLGIIILSYLIGAIPVGLLIVKLTTGKDIREVESGRTGGTNAMRAAGFWAGFATAMLDVLKGAVGAWLAVWLMPQDHWVPVAAALAAIVGHNYSIFLPKRDAGGDFIGFGGGAGGAPSVGGAMGLWLPSVLIILPLGALIFFTVGIASVTTMSVALFAIIIFAVRAYLGLSPWVYVLYGVGAELLLIWALRPNLKKLFAGNERIVTLSLHGWLKGKKEDNTERVGK